MDHCQRRPFREVFLARVSRFGSFDRARACFACSSVRELTSCIPDCEPTLRDLHLSHIPCLPGKTQTVQSFQIELSAGRSRFRRNSSSPQASAGCPGIFRNGTDKECRSNQDAVIAREHRHVATPSFHGPLGLSGVRSTSFSPSMTYENPPRRVTYSHPARWNSCWNTPKSVNVRNRCTCGCQGSPRL